MISPAPILGDLPLFPERASTMAPRTDALLFYLLGVSAFFVTLIFALIVVFVVKYRRRGPESPPPAAGRHSSTALELTWIAIPLAITLVAFAWGASLFGDYALPPRHARNVYVAGRQWMWKVQHPEGRQEINELHIARGRPVKLTLASNDVIHSFYVPAFRVKQDAVPGRYTSLWFEPTRVGRFQLFCAEYCGTNHSKMVGEIVVMEPAAFQAWLGGGEDVPLPERGRRLFEQFACRSCHSADSGARGPDLKGLPGRRVHLADGADVLADDTYLRESILNPSARIVAGYEKIMPTYTGQLDEEAVIALIAYLRTLDAREPAQ